MADKLTQLLLDALGRAALAPGGLPLFGSKAAPGLFPASALGRQTAQRARDDGFLRTVTPDAKGKADYDLCAATDKGLAYLLQQTSPKQVLEDLARAVESRHGQVAEMVAAARGMQTELEALKAILEKVAPQLSATETLAEDWLDDLRRQLSDWRGGGDYPLPDLYRRLQADRRTLTIGQFHDGLRRLHDEEQVYLHPWTGPLYALPEPAFALMIGHEIAYYASPRAASPESHKSHRPLGTYRTYETPDACPLTAAS